MSLDVEIELGEYQPPIESSPGTIEFHEQILGAKLVPIKDYNPAEYRNRDVYNDLQKLAGELRQNGAQTYLSLFLKATEDGEKSELRYGLFIVENHQDDLPRAAGHAAIYGATPRGFRLNR